MREDILKEIGDAVMKEIGEGCEVIFPEIKKNNGAARQSLSAWQGALYARAYILTVCWIKSSGAAWVSRMPLLRL